MMTCSSPLDLVAWRSGLLLFLLGVGLFAWRSGWLQSEESDYSVSGFIGRDDNFPLSTLMVLSVVPLAVAIAGTHRELLPPTLGMALSFACLVCFRFKTHVIVHTISTFVVFSYFALLADAVRRGPSDQGRWACDSLTCRLMQSLPVSCALSIVVRRLLNTRLFATHQSLITSLVGCSEIAYAFTTNHVVAMAMERNLCA